MDKLGKSSARKSDFKLVKLSCLKVISWQLMEIQLLNVAKFTDVCMVGGTNLSLTIQTFVNFLAFAELYLRLLKRYRRFQTLKVLFPVVSTVLSYFFFVQVKSWKNRGRVYSCQGHAYATPTPTQRGLYCNSIVTTNEKRNKQTIIWKFISLHLLNQFPCGSIQSIGFRALIPESRVCWLTINSPRSVYENSSMTRRL